MSTSNAEALEPFRRYLEVLARVHLDPRLRGKLDPADVVQQTLLRACAALPELRGQSPEVLAAWLRKILARTLADTVKHYHRDRRDVDLEHSLEADLDRSSSGLAGWLAADQTSPSLAAQRNEELLRLADALADLPEPHARGRHPQALPRPDAPADRRPPRPDRPVGRLAAAARPGSPATPVIAFGVNP